MTPGQRDEMERAESISKAWKLGFAAGAEAAARLVEDLGDQAACDHAGDIRAALVSPPAPAPVAAPRPQTACDKCSVGVMDADNPHLHGTCPCLCHDVNLTPLVRREQDDPCDFCAPREAAPECSECEHSAHAPGECVGIVGGNEPCDCPTPEAAPEACPVVTCRDGTLAAIYDRISGELITRATPCPLCVAAGRAPAAKKEG